MSGKCHTPLKYISAFAAYVITYYRSDFKMHVCQTELDNDKWFMQFLSSLSYFHKMITLRRKEFWSISTQLKSRRALTALTCLANLGWHVIRTPQVCLGTEATNIDSMRRTLYYCRRELLLLILVNHLIHENIILEREKCLITEIRIYHTSMSK